MIYDDSNPISRRILNTTRPPASGPLVPQPKIPRTSTKRSRGFLRKLFFLSILVKSFMHVADGAVRRSSLSAAKISLMQEQRQKGFLLLSLRSQFAASEGNKGLGHQRQFYDGQAFFSLVPATNCTALLVKEEKGGDILTKIELPSSDNGHGRELKPTRHPAKIRFWHRINPFFLRWPKGPTKIERSVQYIFFSSSLYLPIF